MSSRPRVELQRIFEEILGSKNVYFSPPSGTKLRYPCIIYKLKDINTGQADNQNYTSFRVYDVTLIDENPDTGLVDALLNYKFPSSGAKFVTSFTSDHLMHYQFRLYF